MTDIERSDLDTPKTIEDKVRNLPQNQGINEDEMWKRIDEQVEKSRQAGKLRNTEGYVPHNKHGEK